MEQLKLKKARMKLDSSHEQVAKKLEFHGASILILKNVKTD